MSRRIRTNPDGSVTEQPEFIEQAEPVVQKKSVLTEVMEQEAKKIKRTIEEKPKRKTVKNGFVEKLKQEAKKEVTQFKYPNARIAKKPDRRDS